MAGFLTYHVLNGVLKRRTGAPVEVLPPIVTPPVVTDPVDDLLSDAGSLPIGEARYAIPSGAIFVDPDSGNNSADGSLNSPVRSFERAVAITPANGTIVLRAGNYHEGRTRDTGTSDGYVAIPVTRAGITVQNYPGEAAWFDGSSVVTGFVSDGDYWSRSWTPFRRDPTYSWFQGSYPPANNNWLSLESDQRDGWQFVDYAVDPTAAWPERLWINGVRQKQVDLLSKMGPGKFYIDAYANKLYVGENPTGKKIELTDLQTAINSLADNFTFRGVGVRRYAGSMPQAGPLKVHRPNAIIENVVMEDCAPKALGFIGSSNNQSSHNSIARKVTVRRCSNLGIGATLCDNIVLDRVLVEECNDGRFNFAPSAGGVKFTRFRGTVVKNSVFQNNYGKGLWFDEDVTGIIVTRCDFSNNGQRDMVVELGGTFVGADIRFLNSGTDGFVSVNVESTKLWNCTFLGQGRLRGQVNKDGFNSPRQFSVKPDERLSRGQGVTQYGEGSSVGLDNRFVAGSIGPWPGQAAPLGWVPRAVEMYNCVFGYSDVQAFFGNEDFRKSKNKAESWQTIGLKMDGNVYNANPNKTMQFPWILAKTTTGNTIGSSLNNMRSQAQGLDPNSIQITGASILDSSGMVNSANKTAADNAARPIPDFIADITGQPVGTKHAGAWR